MCQNNLSVQLKAMSVLSWMWLPGRATLTPGNDDHTVKRSQVLPFTQLQNQTTEKNYTN